MVISFGRSFYTKLPCRSCPYLAVFWQLIGDYAALSRIRTWFIEAATCTKDVVILLDNSGSMQGWSKHISFLIVNTILQTLSNNDYINVMNYSETVDYLIPCFGGKLVQATEENIKVILDALPYLEPINKSNVDLALVGAFGLLQHYREIRNCSANQRMCNQAIMLISDGIPSNLSEIIQEYNRLGNDSIPIRIFTYLVGKEPAHLEESMWIACNNRGYHCHVDALEQVTQAVYKYVMVLARPLVLQAEKNPLSWTHAYVDETFSMGNENFEQYRLLTSVAGPAFNKKVNNTSKKKAELLGVAGTDVPIGDIAKLMFPYKTGANSHSFIVSNNGYVLKHPGLSPMFDGELTVNYNSIDLTEVEQLDDGAGPRVIGSELAELRSAMVKGEKGVLHDLKIKFHYDNMRRVSREVNDYYYAPINGTPFSIGFAIPDLYGNYSIEVEDKLETYKHSFVNITSFFNGTNWKIHPKWVYCKYHYLEGHEYETPEKELLHFLSKINQDDFKWTMQYEEEEEEEVDENINLEDLSDEDCGAKTLEDDAYYCDKNLVQHLVFDANITKLAFEEPWTHRTEEEYQLVKLYNATLRFVSTMSGFTRWEYIGDVHPKYPTFGDLYPRAIDERFYKTAVIEHRYNNYSFVYSTPLEQKYDVNLLITGSHAIFLTQDDKEAPGAVVGYQFSHSHLRQQFSKIVSSPSPACRNCLKCEDELDCYIIDHSGYIVVAKEEYLTGRFFGITEGVTMEAMVRLEVFEIITVRNYQAICYYPQWIKGSSNVLTTPLRYFIWSVQWILGQIAWISFKINIPFLWDAKFLQISAQDTSSPPPPKPTAKKCLKNCKQEEEDWHAQNKIPVHETRRTACELERHLYAFNPKMFKTSNPFPEELRIDDCKRFRKPLVLINTQYFIICRPFYLKQIPHTNLLLIAINTAVEETCYFMHSNAVQDIVYENDTTFPCQKLYLNNLPRSPLTGCYNEHPLESEIDDCGRTGRIQFYTKLLIISALLFIIQRHFY
ncbi:voltage-dependent calcium channel subunit alpha-2/delta-4 isoform X3 [Photinus pyralis]|uniref:VWFA domain-containing protein n=1 Tax=Photinus pyralis TaxID=7054 RepID=A0A1Y1KEP9_PHOPY|nr:voltage-dependent calcium channel subunit alpha-2/delta-4 isoform X3 [Photinus pyralis]